MLGFTKCYPNHTYELGHGMVVPLHPSVQRALTLAIFAMAHPTSCALNVLVFCVPYMLPICGHGRHVWDCANLQCNHLQQLHWLSRPFQ